MASGFVTETELAEARRLRQEEWEKVRTADQPVDAPEEEYDSRSLYDRLQEQKNKKDHEFEEAHKLKNMIKGLDDDEVEFLDLVDKNRMHAERQAHMEEQKELNEFRAKVATLQEKRLDEQIQQQVSKPKPTKAPIAGSRLSQKQILAGVVRKRKLEPENEPKSTSEVNGKLPVVANLTNGESKKEPVIKASNSQPAKTDAQTKPSNPINTRMRVIGILPGMGSYDDEDESDSDNSSAESELDSGHEAYDFVGRKIRKTCDGK
ncbi:PSME3-interacting protein [Anopheles ziemanni]|uniref:PSME3-interacting protein n=1 Tax=Anopheles coustani TaxID=139045 RepID=UPI002659F4A2|nr:PSME3-interacting protein [Anopheles coustani]XP_058172770.1 PSME3-interacting protein [Anopheles ziemanni]